MVNPNDLLRIVVPLTLAAIVALSSNRSGSAETPRLLKTTPFGVVAMFLALYLGVFQGLSFYGALPEPELDAIAWWQLFWLHGFLLVAVLIWYVSGWRSSGSSGTNMVLAELGLTSDSAQRELAGGVFYGVVGWAAALTATAVVSALAANLNQELISEAAPTAVVQLAAMPVLLRLAISVSAGVAEEIFFRGFLQPRLGIALTTVLFLLAHAGYERPLMMTGLLVLSVLFGILRKRYSVWVAIWAHTTFDVIQLLLFVPFVLSHSEW